MSLSNVKLLSVPVTDQDAAKDFYVNGLGFELIADNGLGPGQRWVQVGPAGAETSITLVTWFDTMPAGSLKGLVVETDDLDAEVAALTARGVKIDGDIQDQPWGRFVTVHDPDGNGIVVRTTAAAFR